MRNMTLGGGILVGVVLLAGCTGGSQPANDGSATRADAPTTRKVTYLASGEVTETASYTIRTEDGGTAQGDIDLPLTNRDGGEGLEFDGFDSGDFVYISVQNAEEFGSVTCTIMVDGVTIAENTSSGAYKIATCQGTVP